MLHADRSFLVLLYPTITGNFFTGKGLLIYSGKNCWEGDGHKCSPLSWLRDSFFSSFHAFCSGFAPPVSHAPYGSNHVILQNSRFLFFLCWCRESLIEYTCWNGTLFCRWNRAIACSCLLRVLGRIHSTVWFLHFSKRWWWECFTCPLMHEINRVNMTAGFNVTSCSQLLHWKR